MRQRFIIWILAASLFAAFVAVASRLLPSPMLESPLFGAGMVALCVLLAFVVRWRFKLSSDRPMLLDAQTRQDSLVPTIGGALVIAAFLWIAVALRYLSATIGNSLIPFFVLLIVGWSVLTWTSEAVQRSAKLEVLLGVALLLGGGVWLIMSAGALSPTEAENFAIVFVPTLSLWFAGILALVTPLWVQFLRLNGVIR